MKNDAAFANCTIKVLNNWTKSTYQKNQGFIDRLIGLSSMTIVICNVEGSRGIDYKFSKPAHVVCAFEPVDFCTYW